MGKFHPKTRPQTRMFFDTLLDHFLLRFGTPWGGFWGPKLDAKPCTSRPCLSEALGVPFGPWLAPILTHWAPVWTLQDSILDPSGHRLGLCGAPSWIFLGHVWALLAPDLLQHKKPKLKYRIQYCIQYCTQYCIPALTSTNGSQLQHLPTLSKHDTSHITKSWRTSSSI